MTAGRCESASMAPERFVPGLELARGFYAEAVRPILDEQFPDIPHAAALIGYGSEVLGYDTSQSTDHYWGPRARIFLTERGMRDHGERIRVVLGEQLPTTYRGFPTNFAYRGDSWQMEAVEHGPVVHRVEVFSLRGFLRDELGFDPREGVSQQDWLITPSQRLLAVTSGGVFHDGLGDLDAARGALCWYPDDVWLYLIASQWERISQEEAFVGRTAQVGDDLGSTLITARLVRDLARLAFLLERRYAPYSKWLGRALSGLQCSADLQPALSAALSAGGYSERERALCAAYETAARLHNDLGITEPVDPSVRPFHHRPALVLGADRFAEATQRAIADPELRWQPLTGSVDQFADNSDLLTDPQLWRRLLPLVD
jgi:uncharacterized protein DUF4037